MAIQGKTTILIPMSEIIKMAEALKRLSVSKPEEFIWRLPDYLSMVYWANSRHNPLLKVDMKEFYKPIKHSPMEEKLERALDYAKQFDTVETIDRLDIMEAYLNGSLNVSDKLPVGGIINDKGERIPKQGEAYLAYEYDENEVAVGIRVTGMGESFVIARSDAENGKQFTWDEAKKKFKLPTKKQATLMCAVLDELNDMLDRIGGEKLKGWYWTSDECTGGTAWLFYGLYGILNNGYKSYSSSVRPVLA